MKLFMKKITFLLITLFANLISNAQNYQPFQFNKTYRYLNPIDSSIYIQYIDTVISNNGVNKYISVNQATETGNNSKSKNIILNCTNYQDYEDSIVFHYSTSPIYTNNKPFKQKKLLLLKEPKILTTWKAYDSTKYIYGNSLLLSNAPTLYFTYLGKSIFNIPGIGIDSIKTYQVSTDSLKKNVISTLYLSKNYGFVNGINNYQIYSITELQIGIDKEINYSFNIGDTLVYKVQCDYVPNNCKPYYYKVTSSKDTNSLIGIIKSSNRLDYVEYIKKGKFKLIGDMYDLDYGITEIYSQDTGYIYKNELGINYESSESLVYRKSKNLEIGDRSKLLLNINDEEFINYSINQNSNTGKLEIIFNDESPNNVSIYDLNGIEVFKSKNQNNLQLELKTGIYLIKVHNNQSFTTQKIFVK